MKILDRLTLLGILAVLGAIGWDAWGNREQSVAVAAARDTMRVIVHQRDTVLVTIKASERVRQQWDTLVRNVTDTQVVIQRETSTDTVTVPVEVIQRDRAKDSLLSVLYVDRRLDSLWHIQDAKLPHKAPRKWSVGFAAGYGCNSKGCGPGVTAGVTWRR